MKFALYIARRYLLAKKSHNAINIISGISVVGVAVGAMALVVILSVFNGFDELIKSLFNTFNPDLKITAVEGKTFEADSALLHVVKNQDGVLHVAEVVEENALLRYGDKQYIATIKGVSEDYDQVSNVDKMIVEGKFQLSENGKPKAVVGQGVAYFLSIGLNFTNPINIYVPRREGGFSFIPQNAFKKKYVFPSGVFSIQQEYDQEYIILPLHFVRDLLDYENQVTAFELKLQPGVSSKEIEQSLAENLGSAYNVQNRYEQNELFYKIMKSEKWAIYLILSFILAVASFNIIGSLTMLIIEKKKDIFTLKSLGADDRLIRRIFFVEGWLISIVGAITGILLGAFVCWLQIRYELVQLHGSGSFVINAYPVNIQFPDLILVLGIVLAIGLIAAWIPAHYITRRHLEVNE